MQSILPVVQASMLAQHHRRQHLVPAAAKAVTTMHRVALASTGLRLRHSWDLYRCQLASPHGQRSNAGCLRRWQWHLSAVHAVHGSQSILRNSCLPCLNARSSAYLRTWLLHSTVFRERCTLDFHATGLWLRQRWASLQTSANHRRSYSSAAYLHYHRQHLCEPSCRREPILHRLPPIKRC